LIEFLTARDFFADQAIKATGIPRYSKAWIVPSCGKRSADRVSDSERFFRRSSNQSHRHTTVFQGLDCAELRKKIR
ncbi:MAG: hypothetical protein IJW14_05395, partial [Oscillospiraceae bacterium]|nr:hypothetical protein [Oscillospiraceae bacterium]